MKIINRSLYNLLAFMLGLGITGAVTFLVSSSGMMTASVGDALSPEDIVTSNNIIVKRGSGMVTIMTPKDLVIGSGESLRIQFYYDDTIAIDQWSLNSPYIYSFSSNEGLLTVILTSSKDTLNHKNLFTLSTNLDNDQSLPIIDSLLWYSDGASHVLPFTYIIDHH